MRLPYTDVDIAHQIQNGKVNRNLSVTEMGDKQ